MGTLASVATLYYGHKTLGASRVQSSFFFPYTLLGRPITLLPGFTATQEGVPKMLLSPVHSPWLQTNIYPPTAEKSYCPSAQHLQT